MFRRRSNKDDAPSLTEIVKFFRLMWERGAAGDEDIERAIRDPAFAARVKAALQPAPVNVADASLAELIRLGKFAFANDGFGSRYAGRWDVLGDAVRGSFELVHMGASYYEVDAKAEAEQAPGRSLANAYELAAYGAGGWNGSDWVTAFGSSYTYPGGNRSVPCLWGNGSRRTLNLYCASAAWSGRDLVLCVCAEPPDSSPSI